MDTFAWIFLAILGAALGQATMLIADCHRNREWKNFTTSPLPTIVWLAGLLMYTSIPVLCLIMLEPMNRWGFTALLFATIIGGGLAGIPVAWWAVMRRNRGRPPTDRLTIIRRSRLMG